MIRREDMLELTRRMTLKRNCFGRMAGAYMSPDGLIDDTFNIHFGSLTAPEQQVNLALAKTVPFARTNEDLTDFRFTKDHPEAMDFRRLLLAVNQSELKNDALLYTLYEYIGARFQPGYPYGIYVFHGIYDIPLKGTDKAYQWESEEVYSFLICVICPVNDDYEAGEVHSGFLFPAFTDRSSDPWRMALYRPTGTA